jgi:exopolysaccharide biosynthesis protein
VRGKWIPILLSLLFAPLFGGVIAFCTDNPAYHLKAEALEIDSKDFHNNQDHVDQELGQVKKTVSDIHDHATKINKDYQAQTKKMDQMLTVSKEQTAKSADVLDQLLSTILGQPIGQTFGQNATVKVYSLQEAGYSGYMAKVKLMNPKALKMLLAGDQLVSSGETTSHAVKRSGAILGINAGGFAYLDNGNITPIGITVIDGQIKTYYSLDFSFIGFNSKGRLVGGKVNSRQDVENLHVLQGASFLPTLLLDSKKQPIPADWAGKKEPRTLIGHFTNGDLLFIVIDGKEFGGSEGVTLEDAQNKLLEFKVRDAYNLDGGGSSTFVYNGTVLNHPSDGHERRVTTNIVIQP